MFEHFASREDSTPRSIFRTQSASASSRNPAGQTAIAPHPQAAPVCHPLMQRMSLNQLTTFRWTLEEDLTAYLQYGIPAVSISWKKLCESGIQRGIRKIQRSGLMVNNLSWVGGFTGQHGYSLPEAIAEAKRAIRIAGRLKAETVTVVTGPQNRHIDSHASRLVTDALRELGALAAIYDVKLALQPMHSVYLRDWTFLRSLGESMEILDRVALPSVGLALGSYHLIEDPDLFQMLPEIAEQIALVVLADRDVDPNHGNDQKLPGEGSLPIRKLVASLESYGYAGWYQTEVWSQDLWKIDHHDLMKRYQAAQLHCLP